jgi:hypothetical protein
MICVVIHVQSYVHSSSHVRPAHREEDSFKDASSILRYFRLRQANSASEFRICNTNSFTEEENLLRKKVFHAGTKGPTSLPLQGLMAGGTHIRYCIVQYCTVLYYTELNLRQSKTEERVPVISLHIR